MQVTALISVWENRKLSLPFLNRSALLKVGSLEQGQQHHLGTYQKFKLSGPTPKPTESETKARCDSPGDSDLPSDLKTTTLGQLQPNYGTWWLVKF